MRAGPPLWLAVPSRFAGLARPHARWLLAAIGLLLLASLGAIEPTPAGPVAGRADDTLYDGIVDAVRHGDDYYSATAAGLRAGGDPLRPFVTFRLPTLAIVQSWMTPVTAALLLYGVALLTLYAWYLRLGAAFARTPPRVIATVLAAAGMAGAMQAGLVAVQEMWAGLLIALSLALWRPDRWIEPVAIGLAAMLIRETALIYVAVMACFALAEGRRRELLGWIAAVALLAIVLLLHARAVAGVVHPLDQPMTEWAGIPGFGAAVRASVLSTALTLVPMALATPLVALALAGWAGWRDPLAARALATLAACLTLLSLLGHGEDTQGALLIAPLLPIGLAFVPDAVRDLCRAALDRRRITVTRTAR